MKPGDFASAVRLTAERYGMDLGRPLALVSGGPDSIALLRVLVELGGEPAVLHVDHSLRGEESREDAEFVRALCQRLGVRCEVRRLSLEDGPNLQERAREARYRLAEETTDELGLRTIAAGHTADDVAETVLMNLARGAGLRGLSGIPPVRGRLERPLIERTRREILDYLQSLDQPYRTDPTNLTGKYARNRVRLEVMPVLEELYPGAARNLARAAALAREDLEALEGLAAEVVERRGGEVVLPAKSLSALPPALRRYSVRRAYAEVLPGAPPLGSAIVETVLELGSGGDGTPRGVAGRRSRSIQARSWSRGRKCSRSGRRSSPGGGSPRARSPATTPKTRRGPRSLTWTRRGDPTGCGWRGRGISSGRWASGGRRRSCGR